eukprot:Nitzschia sp. Nitz4//scaffold97_size77645//64148//66064//NITZ4_005528-RA/size77645-processed-gene-0.99-mRNA-1//-1//CDS//3329560686//3755//frame0
MKLLRSWLLSLCLLVLAATQVSAGGTSGRDTQTQSSQTFVQENTERDLQTYETGTEVADYFEDNAKWYTGEIESYGNGAYIIRWSDGGTQTYTEDEIADIASNYENLAWVEQEYDDGTNVAEYSDADQSWSIGTIQSFENGIYTIKWHGGGTEFYEAQFISDIVNNYETGAYLYQAYEKGTNVADYFTDDDKWYTGTVTDYQDGVYTIQWSDAGTQEYNADEMEEIVNNYDTGAYLEQEQQYEDGTNVADYFDEDQAWDTGTILSYGNGVYTIEWSDGGTEDYNADEMDEIVNNYDNGAYIAQAYADGTDVADFSDSDGSWSIGTVQSYENGVYTIQWENGGTEQYSAKEISIVVDNFSSKAWLEQSYTVGTGVADYFEDDDAWYTGTVISFDGGVYTIKWSDDTTQMYDMDEIDEIVNNYNNEAWVENVASSYSVGTEVAAFFENEGVWYTGQIQSYEDGVYAVLWDDGSVGQYSSNEIGTIVQNYIDQPWANTDAPAAAFSLGTEVADYFDDDGAWYTGSIVSYNDRVYTIEWDADGSTEEYDADEIDEIVNNAKEKPWIKTQNNAESAVNDGGLPIGGIIAVIVISMFAIGGGTKLAMNRRPRKHVLEAKDSNIITAYTDEPTNDGAFDDLPRIA